MKTNTENYMNLPQSPKLLVLVGLPFGNRDTFAKSLRNHYNVISRDVCREYLFGPHYDLSPLQEKEVDREFEFKLRKAYLCHLDIIYNSSNCSERAIDRIIAECPVEYDIKVKFFEVSLFMAWIRNYARFLAIGRWVPFHILLRLRRGFKAINKAKYQHYTNKFAITQSHW